MQFNRQKSKNDSYNIFQINYKTQKKMISYFFE